MVTVAKVENSHTFGVLDPQMRERRDTKFLQGALDDAVNIITLPQGGYIDRGGTLDFGPIRHVLNSAGATTDSFPNGHAVTDGQRRTDVISSWPATLLSASFGAPTAITTINLTDLVLLPDADAPAAESGTVICEVLIGGLWQAFGAGRAISNQFKRCICFGVPPSSAPVMISGFRFIVSGVSQNSRIGWVEHEARVTSATLSTARAMTFNRNSQERYKLIFTDGQCDVFRKGQWIAAFPFPADAGMVRSLKFTSRYDTIVVAHQDMFPQAIRRLPGDDWSTANCPFVNIPLYDYGGNYSNGVNERQTVTLYGLGSGKVFDLSMAGFVSEQISVGANNAATAANIKAALERVTGLSPGLTVSHLSGTHGTDAKFRVEFTSAGNHLRPWPNMVGATDEANAFVSIGRERKGEYAGEPVFSAARGYPAAAKFVQERLVYAGIKSFGNALGASKTGSPFDLDIFAGGATAGFLYEVAMEEIAPIRDIYAEQGLVLFTDNSVHYSVNAALSAEEAPEWKAALAPGVKGDCPIVRSDTSILYPQYGGQALQTLGYAEQAQNYVGASASVLSAFLIDNPIGAAKRGATKSVSADLVFYVDEGGRLVTLTNMLSQDVSGFCPQDTQGLFHDVVVDGDGDAWFIIDRDEDGVTERRLELMQPDDLLDGAAEFTLGAPATILAGLGRFEEKDVWAIVDGINVQGPFRVENGEIALQTPAESHARVGLWSPPVAIDLPVDLHPETGRPMPAQRRVFQALVSCLRTSSLAVGANEAAPVNIDLQFFGQAVFGGTQLEFPYSGVLDLQGFPGFTPEGQLVVTQAFPGKLNIRSITKMVVA